MHEMELPLVGFTVLTQLAAGLALMVALFDRGDQQGQPWQRYSAYTATGAAVVGLVSSFIHLGRPMAAVYAITGVGRSWMSNEIAAMSLFGLALLVWDLAWYKGWAKRQVWGWVAAILGIVLVGAQIMTYALPSRPNWYGPLTPITFLASMVLLGGLGSLGIAAYGGARATRLQLVVVAVGVVLVAGSIGGGWYLRGNGVAGIAAWVLLSLVLPLGLLVYRRPAKLLPVLAMLFAVAGEVVGRVLFYTSGGHILLKF